MCGTPFGDQAGVQLLQAQGLLPDVVPGARPNWNSSRESIIRDIPNLDLMEQARVSAANTLIPMLKQMFPGREHSDQLPQEVHPR